MGVLSKAKTKIVFVGIGGVGGYYGGLVSRYAETTNPDIEVCFVARGANLQTIRANGLHVSDEHGRFVTHPTIATDNVKEIGKADYIVLSTKCYDLDATMQQIKPIVSSDTILLPLLNGIDNTAKLRAFFPDNEVWYGCAYIITRLIAPGVIEDSGNVHFMHFGHEKKISEQLLFIEDLFLKSGIEVTRKEEPIKAIWRKFFFISTTAALTTYLNTDFRSLVWGNDKKPLYLDIMRELYAISEAENVKLYEGIIDDMLKYGGSLPAGSTSSMNSDYLAGKRTEVESLIGVVVRLGQKHGIPTPLYSMIYEKLK
ncbi:MAG: 2-dehydropantoate 2-reductase [Paludibacter sp.]|nr:2-dehydropantoate 2-reductase [Paludibacter sp.]